MSVESWISKNILLEQQIQFFNYLIDTDDWENLYKILNGLKIDSKVLETIEKVIYESTIRILEVSMSFKDSNLAYERKNICLIAKVVGQSPRTKTKLYIWTSNILSRYMKQNFKKLFSEGYKTAIGSLLPTEIFESVTEEYNIKILLEFLILITKVDKEKENDEESIIFDGKQQLLRLLIILLGCEAEFLSNSALELLRWLISLVNFGLLKVPSFDKTVWICIKNLVDTDLKPWKFKNGLILWLRILMEKTQFSPFLIEYIQSDKYWENLQFGLSHNSHEYRKISLSILKLTLQYIPLDLEVETRYINWDLGIQNSSLDVWKKFTTLYEIVGIDTSLNQFEAASEDILNIFENPDIHPSWGLIILSSGLKASLESVRKYTVYLMFQIKDKSVFVHNLRELREIFLPSAMQASYFVSKFGICPYGETLSNFIKDVVISVKTQEEFSISVTNLLNSVVQQRTAFDPARVYVLYGLLMALRCKKNKIIHKTDLYLIKKLFEFNAEDEIFETTIQTINLQLLLYTDCDPVTWLDTIAFHVKSHRHGYKYLHIMFEPFRDFVVTNYNIPNAQTQFTLLNSDDPVIKALAFRLFDYEPPIIDQQFLLETAKIGNNARMFVSHYTKLMLNLIEGDESFTGCHILVGLSIFNAQIWKTVNLKMLYSKIFCSFDPNKFCFFVEVYQKTSFIYPQSITIKYEDILNLYDQIKIYIDSNSLSFKDKDFIFGNYFRLVTYFLKTYVLKRIHGYRNEDELYQLLSLMDSNINKDNGNYLGNLNIIKLCEYMLDTYITPNTHIMTNIEHDHKSLVLYIVQILKDIWKPMCTERLVLNQKDLHLSLIKVFYHPSIIASACLENSTNAELGYALEEFGNQVIHQALSRRGFLPLLSKQLELFMKLFGDQITEKSNLSWISNLLISIFAIEQMNINGFSLKPVIATLFDEKLGFHLDHKLYECVYGADEISTKVNVISTILYGNSNFKHSFLNILINNSNFLQAKKSTNGIEEIERLSKWELLLLVMKDINLQVLDKYCQNTIIPSLIKESSPLIRIYYEWFISYVLIQLINGESTNENEVVLFSLLEDHSKPTLVVSTERILYIILNGLKSKPIVHEFLQKFLSYLIPNCTSNKPLVRHFSNSLILSLWPEFQDVINEKTLKTIILRLYKQAQLTQEKGKYRAGDANIWNAHEDLTLTNIFGGILLKIIGYQTPYINSSQFRMYLPTVHNFTVGDDNMDLWLTKKSSNNEPNNRIITQKDSPLQTKSGAWETIMDIANHKSDNLVKRSELIVVASLVDKPPNLGGICRLCDVLGVGLLTVHDIKVKNHPQFKNVAVTADHWMPIKEIAIDDILHFMIEKKKQGYTLIGLEQTDKSIQLDNNYKFPTKSLILLGTEAKGIPGYLLSELDLCLEIKQSGIIRSMNIQTATAVIVHSYSVQHI